MFAADAEKNLLTIEGNLIDRVELINKNSPSDVIISAYYNLLSDFMKKDILGPISIALLFINLLKFMEPMATMLQSLKT